MRKLFKTGTALLLTAVMSLGLVACGSSDSTAASEDTTVTESQEAADTQETTAETTQETTQETAEETVDDSQVQSLLGETPLNPADEYFGISLPMTSSEYYKGVEEELSAYCEEFGIKYEMASADSDSQKQLTQFENFMTMGCSTIIVYALDLSSMENIMERAQADGIRVVSATMTPENIDAYTIAIDASQDAVGTAAAEYASQWIDENYPDAEDGSIEVALFTMSSSDNIIERCDGLRKIAELNSKVTIVEDYDIPMDNAHVR